MKYKYIFLILPVCLVFLLIASLLVFFDRAEAQGSKENSTDKRNVEINFVNGVQNTDTEVKNEIARVKYNNFTKDKMQQQIDTAIRTKVQRNQSMIKQDYYPFYTESIKNDNNSFWAVITSYPRSYLKTDHVLIPDILIVAGLRDNQNNWNVVIEGIDKNYNEILNTLPEAVLSSESKQHFSVMGNTGSKYSTQAAESFNIPGLPWAVGESWTFGSAGVHSSNSCCLDFLPPSGANQVAIAAEVGSSIYKNGTCVFYKNGSRSLIYQHLNPTDVTNAPTTVQQGTYLGRLYDGPGCGYPNSVPKHIHIGTWNNASSGMSILGSTINGWTVVDKLTLRKNDQTVKVNGQVLHSGSSGSCTPPSSGNWTINQDCTLTSSKALTGDLIINDGKSLTLSNNVTLDMDLKNYKILIRPNSKLVIQGGARVI